MILEAILIYGAYRLGKMIGKEEDRNKHIDKIQKDQQQSRLGDPRSPRPHTLGESRTKCK